MKIRTSGISKLWLDKVLNFRGGWKTAARQLTVIDFSVRPAEEPKAADGGHHPLGSATCKMSVRYLTHDDGGDDESETLLLASVASRRRSSAELLSMNMNSSSSSSTTSGEDADYALADVAELHWFLKFPAPAVTAGPERAAFSASMADMFERECMVYQRLLPAMLDSLDASFAATDCYPDVPDCIYSNCDEFDVSVVMEDLSTQGFRPTSGADADADGLMTVEEARLALKALARFHASGLEVARQLAVRGGGGATSRREALPALERHPYGFGVLSSVFGSHAVLERMAGALKDVPGQEENAAKLMAFLKKTPPLAAWIDSLLGEDDFPKGYISGDCCASNFMFRYEEDAEGKEVPADVKMLDFQLCHYGLPQADLHHLLNSGMSAEVKSNFDSMLKIDYFEELLRVLQALGSPLLTEAGHLTSSFERFFNKYMATAAFGLMAAMMAIPSTSAPQADEPVEVAASGPGGAAAAPAEDPLANIVRTRFADAVQKMVDLGVL